LADVVQARAYYDQALAAARAADYTREIAFDLGIRGALLLDQGDLAGAEPVLAEGLQAGRACGDPVGTVLVLCELGRLAAARGEYATARDWLEECLRVNQEVGIGIVVASAHDYLGDVARAQGDLSEAQTRYWEGLRLCQRQGDKAPIAAALLKCASVWLALGQTEAAVKLFAVEANWRASMRVPRGANAFIGEFGVVRSESDLAKARATLGEEAFARAWAEGQAMTLEEAIAFALKGEAEVRSQSADVSRTRRAEEQ
jgi:tetratricopeptide (TPR) repeat protein